MEIALLGAGTVGQSVFSLLADHASEIEGRVGEPVHVRRVVVRDVNRKRQTHIPASLLTSDGDACVSDPSIDAVVEVMGGIQPAYQWVTAALQRGKPVVTANKALVAEHGTDLFDAADAGGTDLFFEAAAAGAVPIVRALKLSLAAQHAVRIVGVLNGSTNYLLDALSAGQTAEQAVSQAQAAGYLEADPSDDLSGRDTCRKLAILASIAFTRRVLPDDIPTVGVDALEPEDLRMAEALGRRVKLLAEAEETDHGLALCVGPALVPKDHPLAQIRGGANVVLVSGEPAGDTLMSGQGAGGGPTAVAVLGDLIEAVRLKRTGGRAVGCTCRTRTPVVAAELRPRSIALDLTVEDRPGVLAQAAQAFAGEGLSVRSVLQEPLPDGLALLQVVLHPTSMSAALGATRTLARAGAVRRISPILPFWDPERAPSVSGGPAQAVRSEVPA